MDSSSPARGLLIAAPASGCGKTTVTLGLIRALKQAGHNVISAKAGPDYIDPKFHQAASSNECFNLDPWAMRPQTISALAHSMAMKKDLFIAEGMMGLFDGARDGTGSSADLAEFLGLPVILVMDASSQSHSIAAAIKGFSSYRKDCHIAGIILNKVGSKAHEQMLKDAIKPLGIPVVGVLARDANLSLPSRHLGLVQAHEHQNLEGFIATVATHIEDNVDLAQLAELARPLKIGSIASAHEALPPLGQNIAIARDIAFEFLYPHILKHWQQAGAEVSFFSPLADEAPPQNCDAIFLPGGYPELHAARLSENQNFLEGLRQAANRKTLIYGECGGYAVLGNTLTDEKGIDYPMAGLLPVNTSFAERKLHLGYRKLTSVNASSPWSRTLSAHEFHYTSITSQANDCPLFRAVDATNTCLGNIGHQRENVMGSYAHIIDYCP